MKKLVANIFHINPSMLVGKTSPVLSIKCTTRSGKQNFVSCINNILRDSYPNESIGLGGVFCVTKGKLKIHVMPRFSEVRKTDKAILVVFIYVYSYYMYLQFFFKYLYINRFHWNPVRMLKTGWSFTKWTLHLLAFLFSFPRIP